MHCCPFRLKQVRGKWDSPTAFTQTALSHHPCLAKQPAAVDTAQPSSELFTVFARVTLPGDSSDAILVVSALRTALLTDAEMAQVTSLPTWSKL